MVLHWRNGRRRAGSLAWLELHRRRAGGGARAVAKLSAEAEGSITDRPQIASLPWTMEAAMVCSAPPRCGGERQDGVLLQDAVGRAGEDLSHGWRVGTLAIAGANAGGSSPSLGDAPFDKLRAKERWKRPKIRSFELADAKLGGRPIRRSDARNLPRGS